MAHNYTGPITMHDYVTPTKLPVASKHLYQARENTPTRLLTPTEVSVLLHFFCGGRCSGGRRGRASLVAGSARVRGSVSGRLFLFSKLVVSVTLATHALGS